MGLLINVRVARLHYVNPGLNYGGVQISWRGGFFHYFPRSLLYFCARLARRPAPQKLNELVWSLWHCD